MRRQKDHPSILEDLLSRGFDRSRRIERDDAGRFCNLAELEAEWQAQLAREGGRS